MINGITYYKLNSPYEGDVTKNCSLTGPEIDNNFYTLEGRDIKSITVDGNDIVINLLNGQQLKAIDAFDANKMKAQSAFDDVITDIQFDEENGILKIVHNNGAVNELSGFTSTCNFEITGLTNVAVDETLHGNGTKSYPIGVNNNYKTGQYKPVEEIVKRPTGCGCCNNDKDCPTVGKRILIEETSNEYGMLYNYKGVTQIALELQRTNSQWRVPTKEDWDDMLNAVEPCDVDKNHQISTANRYLGKWAGKILKSTDKWSPVSDNCNNSCGNPFDTFNNMCNCNKNIQCNPMYCGEYDSCCYRPNNEFVKGIDKYGFDVKPAGYADDAGNTSFIFERACFWTATNIKYSNVFVKRFENDKTNVYQDIVAGQNYFSLRLIKDYNGSNYHENEEILGQSYPTVLMPSEKNGKAIWTSVNIYFTCQKFNAITPNNGNGIELSKKYFIDEWNGTAWMRNEVKEGESVVVKNAPNGLTNIEYRVVNNEIVNVQNEVYSNVMDVIKPVITDLHSQITEEINRSVTKDNEHDTKIAELTSNGVDVSKDIEDVKSEINSVKQNLDSTNNVLTDFSQETKKGFETLTTAINNEAHSRIESDNVITQVVNTKVDWTNVPNEEYPERKSIILKNHDLLLGTSTNGSTYNLAMLSKWDVADFGSNQIHLNLNSNDRPSVNDTEKIAYLSDVNGSSEELSETIKNITDKVTDCTSRLSVVENSQLTNEGSNFNTENGVLTIKSKDNTNDIKIQFTMNFGEF